MKNIISSQIVVPSVIRKFSYVNPTYNKLETLSAVSNPTQLTSPSLVKNTFLKENINVPPRIHVSHQNPIYNPLDPLDPLPLLGNVSKFNSAKLTSLQNQNIPGSLSNPSYNLLPPQMIEGGVSNPAYNTLFNNKRVELKNPSETIKSKQSMYASTSSSLPPSNKKPYIDIASAPPSSSSSNNNNNYNYLQIVSPASPSSAPSSPESPAPNYLQIIKNQLRTVLTPSKSRLGYGFIPTPTTQSTVPNTANQDVNFASNEEKEQKQEQTSATERAARTDESAARAAERALIQEKYNKNQDPYKVPPLPRKQEFINNEGIVHESQFYQTIYPKSTSKYETLYKTLGSISTIEEVQPTSLKANTTDPNTNKSGTTRRRVGTINKNRSTRTMNTNRSKQLKQTTTLVKEPTKRFYVKGGVGSKAAAFNLLDSEGIITHNSSSIENASNNENNEKNV